MDPAIIHSTILVACSILMGLNIFFIKSLIVKVESNNVLSLKYTTKVDMMHQQVEDIAKMREDIAVLKYAIVGYLKKKVAPT